MPHRPSEPPREPYGAIATFLIMPLIAATVAFTAPRASSATASGTVHSSIARNGQVVPPSVAVHHDSAIRRHPR